VRDLFDFARAVIEEWKGWLSGSLPMVAIATLSLLKPDIAPLPLWAWITLVFAAGFTCAVYRVYRTVRTALSEAEEKLRQKIKVSFGEQISGCVVPTSITSTNTQAKWVRLKLEADGVGVVQDCGVTLVGLSRDNKQIFDGESIALNMARSLPPRFDRKDLQDQVPEYADLLGITDQNQIILPLPPGTGLPNSIKNQSTLFAANGNYIFKLVVASPATKSVTTYVRMHWTNDWNLVRFYSI
jgi:hypothetical protein